MSGYTLDNSRLQAERRFAALQELFDEATIDHLERIGASSGWDCWELGAGNGSVAAWLAEKVGPKGSVLATDVDTRRITARHARLSVRVHDVVRDPSPEQAYDLIHARLVLVHLAERDVVLSALSRALRPGGWLLIEDFDHAFLDAAGLGDERERDVRELQQLFARYIERHGADTSYARHLPNRMRALGLRQVGGEARMRFAAGASAGAELLRANLTQVEDEMVGAGLCTPERLAAALRDLEDPSFGFAMPLMVSAWGRRAPTR